MLLIAAEEKINLMQSKLHICYRNELVMVTIKCRTSPDFDPMSHYLFKSIFVVRSTTGDYMEIIYLFERWFVRGLNPRPPTLQSSALRNDPTRRGCFLNAAIFLV